MSFFDWFWAAVAASLGWALMPFIVIAALLLLGLLLFGILVVWAWAEEVCRRVAARFK